MYKTMLMVLFLCQLAFPLLGSDESQTEKNLPREISGLELGQVFDTQVSSVHHFEDSDGTKAYVFMDADELAINVDVDDQGRITHLSWHYVVRAEEARKNARLDLENKFGAFFKHRKKTDDGEKLVFQDSATYYTVAFEGHMITIVTKNMDKEDQ